MCSGSVKSENREGNAFNGHDLNSRDVLPAIYTTAKYSSEYLFYSCLFLQRLWFVCVFTQV